MTASDPYPIRPVRGAFGEFGGRYVSELLEPALEELEAAVHEVLPSHEFKAELVRELANYAGRPTPITAVPRYSALCDLDLRLKREDLLHGGAHKTNNVIGQGLLAKRMGKTRLIAETGAGQHGVATAMIGARLGFETVIYMGSVDIARQNSNVRRMQLMGARVIPVTEGAATLKEAINEALRDWAQSAATTHYLLGTVCGPDPFPRLVAYFQSVIGIEARSQWEAELGGLPDAVVACIGGGSNAMGIFKGFEEDDEVRMIGVEPAGHGADTPKHGMTLGHGSPGLLHGARTLILQDADGQIGESHSVAAGLDYPGVGPEHAHLKSIGRAEYHAAPDTEALAAFQELTKTEGILPAFESAHALAFCRHAVERGHLPSGAKVLINLSGRGDKDMDTYLELKGGGSDES